MPLWIQQAMCQALASGATQTIKAAHSDDESDLMDAVVRVVLLANAR